MQVRVWYGLIQDGILAQPVILIATYSNDDILQSFPRHVLWKRQESSVVPYRNRYVHHDPTANKLYKYETRKNEFFNIVRWCQSLIKDNSYELRVNSRKKSGMEYYDTEKNDWYQCNPGENCAKLLNDQFSVKHITHYL